MTFVNDSWRGHSVPLAHERDRAERPSHPDTLAARHVGPPVRPSALPGAADRYGPAAEAGHDDGQAVAGYDNGQATAAEHDDSEPECLDLAALPTAPSEARQFTRRVLEKWRCAAEVIDAVTLAVSELTTNAARALNPHVGDLTATSGDLRDTSPGPPKHLALTLQRLPGQVVIEVSDDAPDLPLLDDADADAESGRGLLIVQASSERWGYRYPPSGGKVVFCAISTHNAPKEPAT